MAQIDSRLQPLFAVMSEAGYDWIVSEILDIVRQGRPRLASESELEIVRAKIDRHDETPESVLVEFDTIESIIGNDQIDLAVELVKGRFENITGMLDESRKSLRSIAMSSEPPSTEPTIAFEIDGEIRWITSETTLELSEQIDRLNENIKAWADSVRTPIVDEQ